MPTIKKYQSSRGYYIRSNIDGRFVTLQLSPEAEGLLSDLEFQHGENLSWQFLKPLCDSGHAYTNNSGTEVSTDAVDMGDAVASNKLDPNDQERLEAFIAEHTSGKSSVKYKDSQEEGITDLTNVDDIDEEKRYFIEQWSPSDDEYEATLNRLARVSDVDGVLRSVAHHGTEHPICVDRFRVSSQDIPTYTFETSEITWTVHDYRTVRNISTDAELFFDIRPGTAQSQSITIGPEYVEWHTKGEQFKTEQIDDFIIVVPDILYYIRRLVSSPNIDIKSIIHNSTSNIPSEDTTRIDQVTEIQPPNTEKYSRAAGTVLTLGPKGYGRIRSHMGHTISFSDADAEDCKIASGDVVTFSVKQHRGGIYAEEIRQEDSDLPSSEIVRNWPKWNDKSHSALRKNWNKDTEQDGSQKDTIVIECEDDKLEHEYITVAIDLLSLYSIAQDDEPKETINTAIRTLLKNNIDGSTPPPRSPVDTREIEISLPINLISMIDSVVNTPSPYDTREQFFSASIQQHIGQGNESEVTTQIPQGYYQAAKKFAAEREISTEDLARIAIKKYMMNKLDQKDNIDTKSW
jgi:hypothetical protein